MTPLPAVLWVVGLQIKYKYLPKNHEQAPLGRNFDMQMTEMIINMKKFSKIFSNKL